MGLGHNMITEGSWWLGSNKDPRWNFNGRGFVGGLIMPSECEDKIKELEGKFGKKPEDLEWGYQKD